MAAFRTGKRSLATALDRAIDQAISIKGIAANNRARMATGTISASGVIALLDNLKGARNVLAATALRPGIGQFAQDQEDDPAYDVAAGFAAMMAAIDAAGLWIIANFPKASDGALKENDMAADGTRTERTFSSAETAGLRTLLDALDATIKID